MCCSCGPDGGQSLFPRSLVCQALPTKFSRGRRHRLSNVPDTYRPHGRHYDVAVAVAVDCFGVMEFEAERFAAPALVASYVYVSKQEIII